MLNPDALLCSLNQGEYDSILSGIYCRQDESLALIRERIQKLIENFCLMFGNNRAIGIFSAPGRTELGGNHTDHQQGRVLAASVDLDAIAAAAPNGTDTVRLYSEGYGLISLNCKELSPISAERGTSISLLRGMLYGASALGHNISGFDVYMTSDVPVGSGLSSSACFEILMGVVINNLFCGGVMSAEQLAKIGQRSENEYFGKPSGLMDQMACSVGGIIAIDFKQEENPAVQKISYDFGASGYALCILNTGGSHANLTDAYAKIPAEMQSVAKCLGGKILSDIPEEKFIQAVPDIRPLVGDRAILRAFHYYNDCNRVLFMTDALEKNHFEAYLTQVKESGNSSFQYLQNISAFLEPADQKVAVALCLAEYLLEGSGACRVHGGGFAGTIQAYVPLEKLKEFRSGMESVLGAGTCRVTSIRPVGGCKLIG